jgi:hypothetical protein
MASLINHSLQHEPPLDVEGGPFEGPPLSVPPRLPHGMHEWLAALEHLDHDEHGLGVANIRWIEAYWCDASTGFSSAGFVLRLDDGRRCHLQCAIDDDNQPDTVAVTVEPVPRGHELPAFNCAPLGGWSREVDEFNVELIRTQREEEE